MSDTGVGESDLTDVGAAIFGAFRGDRMSALFRQPTSADGRIDTSQSLGEASRWHRAGNKRMDNICL